MPAYNFGSTARKLHEEPVSPRHGISVVPGGRHQEREASSGAVLFARLLVALIVAFALIGCVRIALSSATVAAAMEANQIDDQIDEARDVGSQLEVAKSSLANPTRVKRDAISIGMQSPYSSSFIDISGDIVVRDGNGALSLSGTVGELNAQNEQAAAAAKAAAAAFAEADQAAS